MASGTARSRPGRPPSSSGLHPGRRHGVQTCSITCGSSIVVSSSPDPRYASRLRHGGRRVMTARAHRDAMPHGELLTHRAWLRALTVGVVRVAVVLIAAGIGVSAPPAAPAHAHATLVTTIPARNAVVQDAPAEVVLTFTEPVRLVPDRIKVTDRTGARADVGQARAEARTVRIGLRPGAVRGTYVVSYRVTSADNHPVGGSFLYSVGAPSASGSGPGSDTSGSGGAVTVAFPVVRILGYIGLALLVGAALVLSVLWPQRLDRRGAVRLLWIGAIAVAVTGFLEVLLEIWYVSGPLDEVGWAQARTVMLSQYGAAHSVRIGVALAAPLLLSPLIHGAGRGVTGFAAMMLGVLGLATWPASGHPAASPVPALSLVADLTHLAAMSVWLGGLAMLAVFLLPRAQPSELAGIVPIWSRWALVAVSILLATGVVQSVIEVGSVDGLFAAGYGWLVLAKVGLLAGVLGLAWQSRRLVSRVAAHAAGAAARLRGLVLAEAAGIAVVLAVASVLVQTPQARSAEAAAGSNEQTVVLSNSLYRLSVQIVPGTVGPNDLHLYAYTPEGGRADVKEWRATAAPSNQDIESVRVDLGRISPDRAVGHVTLPGAGQWRFVFTLRTTEIDQASVAATFDIGTG